LYTVLVANLDTSAQARSLEIPSHGTETELTSPVYDAPTTSPTHSPVSTG